MPEQFPELIFVGDLPSRSKAPGTGGSSNLRLDMTAGGFRWTKAELRDAARVGMERLHEGSTELDEFLPRSAHVDRMKVRVAAERRRLARKKGEQELAAYEARYGAA